MKRLHLRSLLRAFALAAGLAMALLGSGCFLVVAGAAGAGAGTVAFIDGKLTVSLDHGYDDVVHGTDQAIMQLQFLKVSEARDALKALLSARTADDKKIDIEITRVGDRLTKVEIRVGVFGDKNVSMAILDRIKANI